MNTNDPKLQADIVMLASKALDVVMKALDMLASEAETSDAVTSDAVSDTASDTEEVAEQDVEVSAPVPQGSAQEPIPVAKDADREQSPDRHKIVHLGPWHRYRRRCHDHQQGIVSHVRTRSKVRSPIVERRQAVQEISPQEQEKSKYFSLSACFP